MPSYIYFYFQETVGGQRGRVGARARNLAAPGHKLDQGLVAAPPLATMERLVRDPIQDRWTATLRTVQVYDAN